MSPKCKKRHLQPQPFSLDSDMPLSVTDESKTRYQFEQIGFLYGGVVFGVL